MDERVQESKNERRAAEGRCSRAPSAFAILGVKESNWARW